MSTLTPITPKNAPAAIIDILKAQRVPFLKGSPGIGKSDIIKQVADKLNLHVIDIRLSQVDPTDLQGFPMRNPDTGRMEYASLSLIPLEEDPIPKGKDGFLIFFDEATSAPPAVQAASYKIMLDRKVNQSLIHPQAYIAAAGNLESDRAVVAKMSTALKSRFFHLLLETNLDEWLEEFAYPHGIDDRIISFLRYKPELLHKFDPNSAEDTFPCPRTWEFVNDVLKQFNGTVFQEPHHLITLSGAVGQGAAFEFKTALAMFESCPTIDEIVASPETAKMPEELSQLFSISTLVSSQAKVDNLEALLTYIDRIPRKHIEFRVLTVKDMIKRQPALQAETAVNAWMMNNASQIFGDR